MTWLTLVSTHEGILRYVSVGACLLRGHIHHKASLQRFTQFDKSTGCCAAHSLVEVFSTLTRMPGKHRISGEQAMLFIGSIRERLSVVALTANEYAAALEASAARGIVGGRHLRRNPCALRHQS